MNQQQLNKIDEEFASIIHDVWSKWQEYLHSKCEIQETKVSFPKTLFERWERQISTSYNLLPENEKQSDRDVFEEYYKDFLHSKLQEAYEQGCQDTKDAALKLANEYCSTNDYGNTVIDNADMLLLDIKSEL